MDEIVRKDDSLDGLFEKVSELIEQARRTVATTVNLAEVYAKYQIGRYIVEEEQQGNRRAEYGKQVLEDLSKRLTERFGSGWSYPNLRKIRQFYLVYSNLINSDYQIQGSNLINGDYQIQTPKFTLSWTHYLVLMTINNPDARSFYEIECAQQQWSVRQLSRQVGSSLYERLALSRDKDEVMRLAHEGQTALRAEKRHARGTDFAKRCQHLCLSLSALFARQGIVASQG